MARNGIFEAKEAVLFDLVLNFLCIPLKQLMLALLRSLFIKLQVTAIPCFRNLVWVFLRAEEAMQASCSISGAAGCAELGF